MSIATAPRERPLLYSGAMVRALLSGEKTQTRRAVRPRPGIERAAEWNRLIARAEAEGHRVDVRPVAGACPHGEVGDRLWVREAFNDDWSSGAVYRADDPGGRAARDAGYAAEPRWKPSILMPRRLCRIVLEIVDVRVERVRSITAADIKAEGVAEHIRSKGLDPIRTSFRAAWIDLWDSTNNPAHAWSTDPWVWVVEFRRIAETGRGGAPGVRPPQGCGDPAPATPATEGGGS